MKKAEKRLAHIEQESQPQERQFITWAGKPWTPEQMAEAIRRAPNQKIFWRSLLECFPLTESGEEGR